MKDGVQFNRNRLAILINADNTKANLIEPLLKEIAKYGTANVKRFTVIGQAHNLAVGKTNLMNSQSNLYNNLAIPQVRMQLIVH